MERKAVLLYIWPVPEDSPGADEAWWISDRPPKRDGLPYKTKCFSETVGLEGAVALCNGLPPLGKRVFKIKAKIVGLGEVGKKFKEGT